MSNGLPWIRVYTNLPDDRRSLLLGSLLRNPHAYLHVLALRLWMGRQAPDGVIRGEHASRLVESAAAWTGEAGVFVEAAVQVGFLTELTGSDTHSAGGVVIGYADVSWPEEQAAHVAKLERDRERARQKAEAERLRREEEARGGREHGEVVSEAATSSRRGRGEVASKSRAVASSAENPERASREPRALESRELRVESREVEKVSSPPPGVGAGGQPALFAVPAGQPARPVKARPVSEPRGDPRHAPLVDALVAADAEIHGHPYGFRGGRDAKAVSDCLALADQDPATAGGNAPTEVLRRWRIARRWLGFPGCNSLTDLASHWNAYVREQGAGGGKPLDVRKGNVPAEAFSHHTVGPIEIE